LEVLVDIRAKFRNSRNKNTWRQVWFSSTPFRGDCSNVAEAEQRGNVQNWSNSRNNNHDDDAEFIPDSRDEIVARTCEPSSLTEEAQWDAGDKDSKLWWRKMSRKLTQEVKELYITK
jgi:hypothetical protein